MTNTSTSPTKLEIQQAFAEMTSSLSSQLISSALAMLALEGAFFTFIATQKQLNFCFYSLLTLSAFFFILSIFFGGKGINKLRGDIFYEKVNKQSGSPWFNLQAIISLFALFLFGISFLFSLSLPQASSDIQATIENLQIDVVDIKSKIEKITINEASNHNQIHQLQESLLRIETKIKQLDKIISK